MTHVSRIPALLSTALAAAAFLPAGCRPQSEGVAIQNKGSDTMVNVAQAWAKPISRSRRA